MPGKRVQIDDPETWAALELLGTIRKITFQELFDEAISDLLKKHGQPVGLQEALHKSAALPTERLSQLRRRRSKTRRHRRAA
jgi:hypothetical protein